MRLASDRRLPRAAALVGLALALAPALACAIAVQSAAPDPIVCDESSVALAADDSAALGFSVVDVVARFGGVREELLEHYEGESSPLTLTLAVIGEAELVTTAYPEGVEPGDVPDLECGGASMRLKVNLDFQSADGVFDELLTATWSLRELEGFASVIVDLPVAEVAGAYTSDADFLSFNITLSESTAWGAVVGVIAPEDALASEFNVARFNESTWPQTP